MSTFNDSDLFAVQRGTQTFRATWKSIKDGVPMPNALLYQGVANPASAVPAPPGGLVPGMVYVLSPAGLIDASWTGIGGITALDGQLAIWEGVKWELAGQGPPIPDASETVPGVVELATVAETTAGTDNTRAVTPVGVKAATPDASETVKGLVELATAAETTAGTDNSRAVHPAGLKVELDKKVNKAGDTMTGNLTVPSLNDGPLAGFRNIIINGEVNLNQRSATYAGVAVGEYWADRWKKTAGGMTQIIRAINYVPRATYTLSGVGVTTQQLTAPASGNWTLPNIPSTATHIQLERGTVATQFERRPEEVERLLCLAYYQPINAEFRDDTVHGSGTTATVGTTIFCSVRPVITTPTLRISTETGNHASNIIGTKFLGPTGVHVVWNWQSANVASVRQKAFIIAVDAEL